MSRLSPPPALVGLLGKGLHSELPLPIYLPRDNSRILQAPIVAGSTCAVLSLAYFLPPPRPCDTPTPCRPPQPHLLSSRHRIEVNSTKTTQQRNSISHVVSLHPRCSVSLLIPPEIYWGEAFVFSTAQQHSFSYLSYTLPLPTMEYISLPLSSCLNYSSTYQGRRTRRLRLEKNTRECAKSAFGCYVRQTRQK